MSNAYINKILPGIISDEFRTCFPCSLSLKKMICWL